MISISEAIDAFLSNVKRAHESPNTFINYKSDLLGEKGFLKISKLKPSSPIHLVSDKHGVMYIQSLLDRDLAAATKHRAASCMREFYGFCAYNYDLNINISKFTYALKSLHLLGRVQEVVEYPGDKIQRILDFALRMKPRTLQEYRDRAFVFSLAELGVRVSEACSLKVGQIDSKWFVSFIGKGSKPAKIKAGKNARKFINEYMTVRQSLDESTGLTRSLLPLFSRHDETSGKNKVKAINQKTAQKIIHNMALLALGDEYDPLITCHKFRHYFITRVYKNKGDMKEAQNLARHKDIRTTQRYTHLDSTENARISTEVFG